MTDVTQPDTISSLLYRYANENDLFMAIPDTSTSKKRDPTQKNIIERPRGSFFKSMVNSNRYYNMLVYDVVYNRIDMDAVVPQPYYIIMLENPVKFFIRQLVIFMQKILTDRQDKITNPDPVNIITWFMSDPEKYFNLISEDEDLHTDEAFLEWRRLKNGQSYMLALKGNEKAKPWVDDLIDYVSTNFDLILIHEFFDRSLLLLKRQLCLSWSDILYLPSFYKMPQVSPELNSKILEWNWLDKALYDHYSKMLENKITHEYGTAAFEEDLAYFRTSLKNTIEVCTTGEITAIKGAEDPSTPTLYGFTLLKSAPEFCAGLATTSEDYIKMFKEKLTAR